MGNTVLGMVSESQHTVIGLVKGPLSSPERGPFTRGRSCTRRAGPASAIGRWRTTETGPARAIRLGVPLCRSGWAHGVPAVSGRQRG